WVLSVMGDYGVDLGSPKEDPSSTWDISASKLIPQTGSALVLSVDGDSPLADPSTLSWSASLTQDLARNAFGRTSRIDAELGALDVTLARYQLVEAYEEYLASLATLYVRWFLAYRSLE